MKKKVLLIVILLLTMFIKVNAKTINDIACNYTIKCKEPYNGNIVELGYMQLLYNGYNDGSCHDKNSPNYNKGSFSVFYRKDNDSFQETDKISNISKSIQTIKFDNNNKNFYLSHGDYDGRGVFTYLFEQNAHNCPNYYCAVNSDSIYITGVSNYTGGNSLGTSDYMISPTNTLLRNTETNRWETREDFFTITQPITPTDPSNPTNPTTPKDPLVCKYTLTPMGEYYDTGLNTGIREEKVDIELITNYDPQTGNITSYNIKANGSSPITPFKEFNEDVILTFSGTYNQNYQLYLRKNQLNKLYPGTCPDKDNLYLYMNKNEIIAGTYGYVLTTDKDEVSAEISDVDFDHNNSGSNQKPSTPIIDLNDNNMTCKQILGENLTNVFHSAIKIAQIAGTIISIIYGMITLMPAIIAKDEEELKKSEKKLITVAIILVCLLLLPSLAKLIGKMLGFDLTCLL